MVGAGAGRADTRAFAGPPTQVMAGITRLVVRGGAGPGMPRAASRLRWVGNREKSLGPVGDTSPGLVNAAGRQQSGDIERGKQGLRHDDLWHPVS